MSDPTKRLQFLGQMPIDGPPMPAQIDAGWSGGGAVDPSQLSQEEILKILEMQKLNQMVASEGGLGQRGLGDYWAQQGALTMDAAQGAYPVTDEDMAKRALIEALQSPVPEHPAHMAPRGRR